MNDEKEINVKFVICIYTLWKMFQIANCQRPHAAHSQSGFRNDVVFRGLNVTNLRGDVV